MMYIIYPLSGAYGYPEAYWELSCPSWVHGFQITVSQKFIYKREKRES